MPKLKVAVLYGAKSSEHEVSVVSASNVMEAMDKDKYEIVKVFISKTGEWFLGGTPEEGAAAFSPWDLPKVCSFVLPIIHGPNAEDGTVQGLLELLNLPYGGSGVVGCATAMDKIVAKEIFANAGLKQTPYIAFSSVDVDTEEKMNAMIARAEKELRFPVFVKPANMGSSVGITKVANVDSLAAAIKEASEYDHRLLIEQGVDCRELETGIMGNEELENASVGEILTGDEFYSYDDKYVNGVSQTKIPADITDAQTKEIQENAKIAYKALGCCGFARVDFMLDKHSGEIFINEINAIPGFTSISMFPKVFMDKGYSYSQIIDRIIELGYERYNLKNHR